MTFSHFHLVTNGSLEQLMYCMLEFRGVNLIIGSGNLLHILRTRHQPFNFRHSSVDSQFPLSPIGRRETNGIEKQPIVTEK